MLLDTLYMDENNFFLYEIQNASEGLYTFHHSEYQMFYLEPGDSLLMRVNTLEFDESLAYSGRGAEKNNLLMEFFLMNEKENKELPKWYMLPIDEFQKKIDSAKNIRVALLEDFIEKHKPSKNFIVVARANIKYDYYSKKELYTTAHIHKKGHNAANNIPKDFYSYRKNIDFDATGLSTYYPYYRFLNRYFDNLAYSKYKNKHPFDRNSYAHIYHEIKAIDSLVSNAKLRDNLLRANVRSYLITEKDIVKEKEIEEMFLKLNQNIEHQTEIERLYDATVNIAPGNKVPTVDVVSTDNIAKDLQTVINQPTVLYFWSSASQEHHRYIHTRVEELASKFPEYAFIGINMDTNFKNWRRTLKQNNYNTNREFQFENISEAQQKLVLNSANKAMIIDKKGIILEANTNIFNQNIETQLVGFLNR